MRGLDGYKGAPLRGTASHRPPFALLGGCQDLPRAVTNVVATCLAATILLKFYRDYYNHTTADQDPCSPNQRRVFIFFICSDFI